MTFEELMFSEILPAECDDERVMVGMKLAWDAAYSAGLERAAEITENSIGEDWACCTNSVMAAVEAILEERKK